MIALRPNPKLACKEARRMVTSSESVQALHAFRRVIVDHRYSDTNFRFYQNRKKKYRVPLK